MPTWYEQAVDGTVYRHSTGVPDFPGDDPSDIRGQTITMENLGKCSHVFCVAYDTNTERVKYSGRAFCTACGMWKDEVDVRNQP